MGARMLQYRETADGPLVLSWDAERPEAICESSGRLIVAGTDRCEQHAEAELSCVHEWRVPPECRHPGTAGDADDPLVVRCIVCGAEGVVDTERWAAKLKPAAAGFESYEEVIALGDPNDDHSARIMPAES